MLRELTSHRVSGLNEAICIGVLDPPGPGNASHKYVMFVPNDVVNQELNASLSQEITFQQGPIKEAGPNGFSNEALLAIVEDRLAGFESGPYACEENAAALNHVREAMKSLHQRTLKRVARGVEGTSVK
jgi:hypothetical protein